MKRMSPARRIALVCALSCGATSVLAQTSIVPSSTPGSKVPVQSKRVMAPPAETRATIKLRPSTSEAGQARAAKPPLQSLPALRTVRSENSSNDAARVPHTGHWLLLYRTEHCVPCDRLMNVLAASESADLRTGTPYTIVVGGSSSSLDAVRTQYSTLAKAQWAADPDRTTFKALQLRGAPELFAMEGDRIVWKVSGNLGNPQQVLQRADAWVAGTAAADAVAVEKATVSAKSSVASKPLLAVKR